MKDLVRVFYYLKIVLFEDLVVINFTHQGALIVCNFDYLDRLDGLTKMKANELKPMTEEEFMEVHDGYNAQNTTGKKKVCMGYVCKQEFF